MGLFLPCVMDMESASSASKAHALASDADPVQSSLKLPPESEAHLESKSGTHRGHDLGNRS